MRHLLVKHQQIIGLLSTPWTNQELNLNNFELINEYESIEKAKWEGLVPYARECIRQQQLEQTKEEYRMSIQKRRAQFR